MMVPFRMFASAAIPEPLSISALHRMGLENYQKTKPIDYAGALGDAPGFGAYEE